LYFQVSILLGDFYEIKPRYSFTFFRFAISSAFSIV
jgi:hypothetical protein